VINLCISNTLCFLDRLTVQLDKRYPYVPPTINFDKVKGLAIKDQNELVQQLNARCEELSKIGSVMVCELVQLTEDFLHSHGINPNVSAWQHMKFREAREEEERKIKLERERSFMNIVENSSPSRRHLEDSQHSRYDSAAHSMIQKELDRQVAALSMAADGRRNQKNVGHENADKDASSEDGLNFSFDEEEDDDDDFQFDEPVEGKGSSSRYISDFIELGELGRGGGGTVFKVRNRLDRRICKYATS